MKIPPERLATIAEHALQIAANGVRENTCDVVANEFASLIESEHNHLFAEGGPTVHGATSAPVSHTDSVSKHFVALVPCEVTTTAQDTGYIVVDPTIKQFNDKFECNLPGVAVLFPKDPRRNQWYDYIEIPAQKH